MKQGSVIVFPSYIFHRVTPMIKGVRKSLVVWVVGDQVKNGGETGNSFRQALSFISKGFLL